MEFFDINKLELGTNSPYSAPVFKPVKDKKWVPYLDTDKSQFPDKLIYYKNNCALHGSIVRSKARQFAGNGFTYDVSTDERKAKDTQIFLTNFNAEGEDANDVLMKVGDDFATFGGFALAIVWSKDYKKITAVEHLDFSKLRSGTYDISTGKIITYYFSYDWTTQRPVVFEFPAFSFDDAKKRSEDFEKTKKEFDQDVTKMGEMAKFLNQPTTQIMYCKPYAANSPYYPNPDYIGAINAIATNIETDQYGINSMQNGLAVDFIVKFKGNYTDEQKEAEATAFMNQFTNPARRKKPICAFAPDAESMMEVENISGVREDKTYTTVNENAQQEILSGHGIVSRMLVGLEVAGSLGGKQEIEDAERLFYKTVIKPGHNFITKAFNKIMAINDLEELSIERLTIFDSNMEIQDAGAETEETKTQQSKLAKFFKEIFK